MEPPSGCCPGPPSLVWDSPGTRAAFLRACRKPWKAKSSTTWRHPALLVTQAWPDPSHPGRWIRPMVGLFVSSLPRTSEVWEASSHVSKVWEASSRISKVWEASSRVSKMWEASSRVGPFYVLPRTKHRARRWRAQHLQGEAPRHASSSTPGKSQKQGHYVHKMEKKPENSHLGPISSLMPLSR